MQTYLSYYIPFPKTEGIFFYSSHDYCLKQVLNKWLKQANHSIHLWIYNLSDLDIAYALNNLASKGIKITIYYHFIPSSIKKNLIYCNLVPFQKKALMHKKLLIIDKRYLLVGSANFSESSLLMHENTMVGLQNTSLAQSLLNNISYEEAFPFSYYLLPKGSQAFLQQLINTIHLARKTITMSMYCLSNPLIIEALKEAADRGVMVTIYCEKRSYLKALMKIANHPSIDIHLIKQHFLIHHKIAMIDSNILYMGSANWSKNGFKKNDECIFVFHELENKQKKIIQKIFYHLKQLSRI